MQVSFGNDETGVVSKYDAETGELTIFKGELDEGGTLQLSTDKILLPADHATLIQPSKKDRVKIVGGDAQNIGQIGELIGIDSEDGIVKTERGDIAILLLRDIGRLQP